MSRFLGTKGHRAVLHSFELPDHRKFSEFRGGVPRQTLRTPGETMQHRKVAASLRLTPTAAETSKPVPHFADQHVGRQLASIRVQSDISQARLASAVGISFQQLQKYESAKNRVSASMLFDLATSLNVPVARFFEGLPGNGVERQDVSLPVDDRINFIASAEGRRLIEAVMRLHPRIRSRVTTLVSALGEEL